MGWLGELFFVSFLIFTAAIDGTYGDAMVTGTVFCDQCKDGQRSLFDYPMNGVKVKITCTNNSQTTISREETTNWFGNYAVRFDGAPDLSGCYAQVSSGGQASDSACTAAAGPAQQLRLMFRMFDMEMYAVDSLLTQPSQPMSICPSSTNNPVPSPPVATPVNPPVSVPPPISPIPNLPPPGFWLPTLPPMPPVPFLEATACSHENWTSPEYKCYWRAVNPETTVATIFGPLAARQFGTDMTLWQGLQGRGDPQRTLLREAITSFLNSYNTLVFPYNTLSVIERTNLALMGSTRNVLFTALRFKRANSGNANIPCKFTPCN